MYSINFVRKRRRQLTKLEVRDQQFLRWAMYAAGVVFAIFLIVLGIRIALGIMVSATNVSINSLKKSIAAKNQIEEQYVVFMTKVTVLTDLFSQRKEKQEGIAYFSSLFDPAIKISQMSFTAETNTLDFTLKAPSIFDLEKAFSTLRSANVREKYPSYSVQRLSRSADGSYGLVINLPLSTRELGNGPTVQEVPTPVDELGNPLVEEVMPASSSEETESVSNQAEVTTP